MKILAISDTHGDEKNFISISELWKNKVDYMFHLGDSQLPYEHKSLKDYKKVKGNCDFDTNYEKEILLNIDKINVLLVHGDKYGVKWSLDNLSYRAEEVNAQVVFYGDSHVDDARKINGTIYINPGSTRIPMNNSKNRMGTYALVSIENKDIIVEYYYLFDHELFNTIKLSLS